MTVGGVGAALQVARQPEHRRQKRPWQTPSRADGGDMTGPQRRCAEAVPLNTGQPAIARLRGQWARARS